MEIHPIQKVEEALEGLTVSKVKSILREILLSINVDSTYTPKVRQNNVEDLIQ